MGLQELLLTTFLAALVTDLATGLGAIPFFFVPQLSRSFNGVLLGFAGGMMTTASMLQLLAEAVQRAPGMAVCQVASGIFGGLLFFAVTTRWFQDNKEFDIGHLRANGGVSALLVLVAMTIHSFPEGVAIGVAYGSSTEHELSTFGLEIAVALAVHNIPEGLAITAALRGKGISTTACMLWAVVSSVPQPLAAVPSAWAVWVFQPLLPFGLGFAAGAMLFLVVHDMLPEALEDAGRERAAWSFCVGVVVMTGLSQIAASVGH